MRTIMTGDQRALADPPAWFGVKELGDFAVTIEGRGLGADRSAPHVQS
jgi:hypothetical protein